MPASPTQTACSSNAPYGSFSGCVADCPEDSSSGGWMATTLLFGRSAHKAANSPTAACHDGEGDGCGSGTGRGGSALADRHHQPPPISSATTATEATAAPRPRLLSTVGDSNGDARH
ncbi:hypothetical protein Cci01nite_76650 [Catellatospora citrea]|uniref:Uncharacterized protein n=1 Tax=Catellatospora citrea TaxID=53366 RepID=A0A8J3KML1_9ACTN|nr:hypothetical protein Cci01nite_76650 [Catellatospora citrea]